MVRNLIAAEWRKLVGHTKAISFLVWIYPVGALVIVVLFFILPGLLFDSVRDLAETGSRAWTDDLLLMWDMMNTFPGGTFVRIPFIAFIAVAFAGEYQWGTWKNILPGQSRVAIVVTKFLVLTALILFALMLTSLIIAIGGWLTAVLFGVSYGPSFAEVDVAAYFKGYVTQVLATFAGTLIGAAYTALIAMYSRSILASVLLSVGVGILEIFFALMVAIVSQLMNRPNFTNIIVATPTYNLENIRSWVIEGIGSSASGLPGLTMIPSFGASVVIVLLWLVGLVGLTAVIFQRQDITN